jgi:hypothetical protein
MLVINPESDSEKTDVAAGDVGAFNGANWRFEVESVEDDSSGGRN